MSNEQRPVNTVIAELRAWAEHLPKREPGHNLLVEAANLLEGYHARQQVQETAAWAAQYADPFKDFPKCETKEEYEAELKRRAEAAGEWQAPPRKLGDTSAMQSFSREVEDKHGDKKHWHLFYVYGNQNPGVPLEQWMRTVTERQVEAEGMALNLLHDGCVVQLRQPGKYMTPQQHRDLLDGKKVYLNQDASRRLMGGHPQPPLQPGQRVQVNAAEVLGALPDDVVIRHLLSKGFHVSNNPSTRTVNEKRSPLATYSVTQLMNELLSREGLVTPAFVRALLPKVEVNPLANELDARGYEVRKRLPGVQITGTDVNKTVKIDVDGLAWEVLEMCKARGWDLKWTQRGCYLHLEVSELIEAWRGKTKGGEVLRPEDPRYLPRVKGEAADVLLVLMSITQQIEGLLFSEVIQETWQTCQRLKTAPPYPGEERA